MGDWQPECSSDTVLAASILVNSGICADWLSRKIFRTKMKNKFGQRNTSLVRNPPKSSNAKFQESVLADPVFLTVGALVKSVNLWPMLKVHRKKKNPPSTPKSGNGLTKS